MIRKIDSHFMNNEYSYDIQFNENMFIYKESINGKVIKEIRSKGRLIYDILTLTDMTAQDYRQLYEKLATSYDSQFLEKYLKYCIQILYDQSILYHYNYAEFLPIMSIDKFETKPSHRMQFD